MSVRNSVDLVTEALANLGVLAAGQPIDPEDFAYVNEKLDAIFRKLAALEICYIPDPTSINAEWFSDLADIVAGECATKFGSEPGMIAALVAKGLGSRPPGSGDAAMSLRQIARSRPTGEVVRAEYM
jgi:hypothetical protein